MYWWGCFGFEDCVAEDDVGCFFFFVVGVLWILPLPMSLSL